VTFPHLFSKIKWKYFSTGANPSVNTYPNIRI